MNETEQNKLKVKAYLDMIESKLNDLYRGSLQVTYTEAFGPDGNSPMGGIKTIKTITFVIQ